MEKNIKHPSFKIIFTSLLFLSVIFFSNDAKAATITTYVNAQKINFTSNPINENGRTLVEFKPIFKALGLDIEWYSASKTIVGKNANVKIQLTLGSKIAYVNGNKVTMEVAPKVINGRTFIPLRFVSDSTNSDILYHASVDEIDIYSKNYSGEKRTPSKSNKALRGTKWSMTPAEVKKIETATFVESAVAGNVKALYYSVGKYGYSTQLVYYFEDEKLIMAVYDFLNGKEAFFTWSEKTYIHDLLHKAATHEFGKGSFYSDDYVYLSTLWNTDSSSILLSVKDDGIYSSVKLMFTPYY